MSELKTTGNLYVNDYKKEKKHPDFTGYLDITREQIRELVKTGKEGGEVKLKLGMWRYPSKRNANQDRFFVVAEAGTQQQQQRKTDDWGDDDDTPF